ncbi:hypothetical protein, partial [Dyella sp. ASV21]|uniref:hypothetical protein n=1 Tax=Dyella sp. ASV21 TaxID=2795114 RepID=UPI0018ED6E5E
MGSLALSSNAWLAPSLSASEPVETSPASTTATAAFSLYWSGGRERGDKQLSIDDNGILHLRIGSTSGSQEREYNGVGIYEARLDKEGLTKAHAIVKLLCREDIQSDSTYRRSLISDAPSGFSVTCLHNGKKEQRGGSFWLMPRALFSELGAFYVPLERWVHANGRKVVKLDVTVADVKPQPHNFLVTVRFTNSGERAIRFKDPSYWSGNVFEETLGIGAPYPGDEGVTDPYLIRSWGFEMAGATRVSASSAPNEDIELAPKESRDLTFIAPPMRKTYPGSYNFAATVYMNIQVDGVDWTIGRHVDFSSDRQEKSPISITRGYPATPQEMDEFEIAQRTRLAERPLQVGQKVQYDGYYRPYDTRSHSEQRGRFVVRFERGQVAPDPSRQLDEGGRPMGDGSYEWLWQADIDSVMEASSRMPCPKSGRWLAKLPEGSARVGYSPNADTIVTCQRGELLPAVGYANP